MRLAWLTDIHMNFVGNAQRQRFLESVRDESDAVAVCGDIAEAHDVVGYLVEMEEVIQKPVFFVLGNHDFYGSSITKTRSEVAEVAQRSEHLTYLTATGVVELTPETAIIGHDGWPDGRLGDYDGTTVILSDHSLIEEIARSYQYFYPDKHSLRATMTALADEATRHFERAIKEAASTYEHVIAVTHVPPYREAAWYQGKTSDDDYLPYFACKVVGEVLTEVMKRHPQSKLTVLCGHTHDGGEIQVLDNLRVLTGEAKYGRPKVQRVLEL